MSAPAASLPLVAPRDGGGAALTIVAAGLLHVAPALAALLFLAGLGVMARAGVADEEAFLGWLFLLAVAGVVGAAVGL